MKRNILKSPILHFITLGIAAFILYEHLKPPDRETIHVTAQTIDALIQQHESLTQSPATPEERESLIQGHIEEEILLREAYKRGFDKNDYRVRKRILNIMRTAMTDAIPEPSAAQLRAYYEENRERFMTSPSRSLEHVYFSFASSKLPDDPQRFIAKLRQGADISGLGEFFSMGNTFKKASYRSTATTFGKPFARTVFDMHLNVWRGPIESFQGVHYVRVTAEHEPELAPFDRMESYLRADFIFQKGREDQTGKIKELRRNYRVVVEGAEVEN